MLYNNTWRQKVQEKVAVIGGGSFGTALATLAAVGGYDVKIYAREKEVIESINTINENLTFLPNIKLPKNLTAADMQELHNADETHFIWTVPSQFTRSSAQMFAKVLRGKEILIATKGVEIDTGKLMLTILTEEITAKYSVLSGPSFAKEVANHKPTTVTVASYSTHLAQWWQKTLSTDYFRVYTSEDMIGLEVGGSVKNVIAIAAGMSDGMKFDNNARAGLITRGLAEITRFGLAYGAKRETFVGLSGLGDLVLTCSGELSRNHQVGSKLVQGLTIDDIMSDMKMVAEGVPTAKAVYFAAKERGVEMPICTEVYKIIYEKKDPMQSVRDLMLRPLKREEPF